MGRRRGKGRLSWGEDHVAKKQWLGIKSPRDEQRRWEAHAITWAEADAVVSPGRLAAGAPCPAKQIEVRPEQGLAGAGLAAAKKKMVGSSKRARRGSDLHRCDYL